MALVLAHGWGFDRRIWARLAPRLGDVDVEALDCRALDVPPTGLGPGPLVGIGHSAGFLWLLEARGVSWRGLVSIAGFPRFTAGPGFEAGVPARVLSRMIAAFERDPGGVLRAFRERAGGGFDGAPADGLARDDALLAAGLRWLARVDARGALERFAGPVLALAGADDDIVPRAMSEAAFAHLPQASLEFAGKGGHLLPLSRPDWCCERIAAFLGANGLLP